MKFTKNLKYSSSLIPDLAYIRALSANWQCSFFKDNTRKESILVQKGIIGLTAT